MEAAKSIWIPLMTGDYIVQPPHLIGSVLKSRPMASNITMTMQLDTPPPSFTPFKIISHTFARSN